MLAIDLRRLEWIRIKSKENKRAIVMNILLAIRYQGFKVSKMT